ncbi:MAG: hypothetical protein ABI728_01320 [Betaproteobacteria bacterium]
MLYTIWNGPMPTTAAQVPVTTGTAIKTMLQLKPFNICKIRSWGISFDGSAAAAGIKCELLDTGTIFGTVTASADVDVHKVESVEQAVASIAGLTLGTSATGYTCTSEGSITAVRMFDAQLIQPTNQYKWDFPLGCEPRCIIGNAVRIRVTAAAAVNALCFITVDI